MQTTQKSYEWPIGFELEPFEYVASSALCDQYLYALAQYDDRYTKGDRREVAPGLLLNMCNRTRSPSYNLDAHTGGLHARDEVSFYRPAYVGDRIRVQWKVVDRYEKRGRTYVVVEVLVQNQNQEILLKRRSHETYTSGG
jgi:hypothetical protein